MESRPIGRINIYCYSLTIRAYCHIRSYSVLQVTFVILCGYLVDSAPTGSGRKVAPSIDRKCQEKMKAMYAKQINAHTVSATHNLKYEYPVGFNETEKEMGSDFEQDCPLDRPTGNESNLSDRSLCPWYPIVNYDRFRYPQDLIDVKCRCENCIAVEGRPSVCEPIYYNVPVLRYDTRRGQGDCASRLKWSSQPVGAGCTCASKRSH